jgi:uncharacterized protein
MLPIQKIIAGPAGNLELLLEIPTVQTIKMLGIVCHPHPLYEGSMHNKVVTTLARVFNHLGAISVRFNFRGVGKSEGQYADGVGELADLHAVIAYIQREYPEHQLSLAGFSFGAYIAACVAIEVQPAVLITIAPAVHHQDFKQLAELHVPWIVVQGEADEVVPPGEVFAWLESLPRQPVIVRMPGVGHFFHGKLLELRETLIKLLTPIVSKLT